MNPTELKESLQGTKKAAIQGIKGAILASDKVLFRAILAIYKRQTEDEKSDGATRYDNGVGFSGVDSFILTSFAEQLLAAQRVNAPFWLSSKQKEIARRKMVKYARQLLEISKANASQTNSTEV